MEDIDRAEAYGDVYIVTPTEVVRGDQAIFTADDDTIVVTGHVVLMRGESVAEGRRLVVERATGASTLEGDGATRTRTIVYPKTDKANAPH
jgi:lipopolysaccharide export system protein LptA